MRNQVGAYPLCSAELRSRKEYRVEELQRFSIPEASGITVANSLEALRARHDSLILKAERNTWLLFSLLYKDRLLHADPTSDEIKSGGHLFTLSQKQIKKRLIERSRTFRESRVFSSALSVKPSSLLCSSQIVVKWLEKLATLEGLQTYRIDARWALYYNCDGTNNYVFLVGAIQCEYCSLRAMIISATPIASA